ncbi:MAG: DUF4416 family protein [Proteobacteria bacterium]|nr:DUF4416 family protein [Pseudomonadota bacterium]
MNDHSKTAKPFFSVFSADRELIYETMINLSDIYGEIDSETDFLSFNQTSYYEKEFGKNLERKIFSIKGLINPLYAIDIKLMAMEMEESLSRDEKRTVNIDPGYVELSHIILTTRKPYSHRIYIGKGVYADLTLIFKKGLGYVPLEWTYPDYASAEYRNYFNKVRDLLKINLKGESN